MFLQQTRRLPMSKSTYFQTSKVFIKDNDNEIHHIGILETDLDTLQQTLYLDSSVDLLNFAQSSDNLIQCTIEKPMPQGL